MPLEGSGRVRLLQRDVFGLRDLSWDCECVLRSAWHQNETELRIHPMQERSREIERVKR